MKQPSIGEKIKYGAYGECEIIDKRIESIGGQAREFYVLLQRDGNSTIFVPVSKAASFKEIKAPLTVEEIKSLSSSPVCEVDWSLDDKTRNLNFKSAFERDDILEISGLMLAILSRQKELKTQKKKLRSTDLNALRICEKILYDELSRTITLKPQDVHLILNGEYEL